MTLEKLIKKYFTDNPNRDITQLEITSWLKTEYKLIHGKEPQDPWRSVRQAHQEGFLIKVKKGVYKYDPSQAIEKILYDFTKSQKDKILKRDGYKCVICGKGKENGVELHIDHIKPKEFGGLATIENGQTLCAQHNFQKRTLKQTETGKKMFIRLYELAKSEGNAELIRFCADILSTFEKHNINGHIEWEE
jgi:hypothetical protein